MIQNIHTSNSGKDFEGLLEMIDFTNIDVGNLTMVLGPDGTPLCAVPFGLSIPTIGTASVNITGRKEASAILGMEVPSPQVPVAITSLDGSGVSFGPCTSERELALEGMRIRNFWGNDVLIANALLPKVLVERWSQEARAAKAAEVARGKQLPLDI